MGRVALCACARSGLRGASKATSGSLRRRLGNAMLALDCCESAAVEIVDVAAYLQLALVIDKGRLIGQVDPDRHRLERDLVLGAAVHAPDLLGRPLLIRARDVERTSAYFGA